MNGSGGYTKSGELNGDGSIIKSDKDGHVRRGFIRLGGAGREQRPHQRLSAKQRKSGSLFQSRPLRRGDERTGRACRLPEKGRQGVCDVRPERNMGDGDLRGPRRDDLSGGDGHDDMQCLRRLHDVAEDQGFERQYFLRRPILQRAGRSRWELQRVLPDRRDAPVLGGHRQ